MAFDVEGGWQHLPVKVQQALIASWETGNMPAAASALYSRWWQLETWLRSLVYVELRSAKGAAWADALSSNAVSRQRQDEAYHHMPSPDALDELAYLDAAPLLELTIAHWQQFAPFLPRREIWAGRIVELKAIRNRIGHCRRPHVDDLDRLEQTLRDLESGALRAASSFNDKSLVDPTWADVLVHDWVRENHADANVIPHARAQYTTDFWLKYSKRPWATPVAPEDVQLGLREGYVWHACWYFQGGWFFDLSEFWEDIRDYRDLILLVCADSSSSLEVSFSALEDPKQVSEAISRCFHAALENKRMVHSDPDPREWTRRFANVDPRVHTESPWACMHPAYRDATIFGA
jgi:hypothetical protein